MNKISINSLFIMQKLKCPILHSYGYNVTRRNRFEFRFLQSGHLAASLFLRSHIFYRKTSDRYLYVRPSDF